MKQVILLRQDLKLPLGKASSQVAHASTEAALRSSQKNVKIWQLRGAKKVVLKVKDENELIQYHQQAKDAGLISVLITDAGHTAIPAGTRTCVGIGPDDEDKIDDITGKLKMV